MTASPPRPQQIPARVTSIIAGHALPADLPGHDIPVVNPTSEEVISTLREADAAEVDAAVRAARQAFDEGPWPRMDINTRKDILYSVRDHLRRHAEELAWLECTNAGLPLASVLWHVQRIARNFEFFAEVASTARGETYNQTAGILTIVTREPKGVAAV
ncbi:MAG: aldehyde dehydrogenase family protein, partial [Gammaproteobacteria bacterium]